jgi:hypothetical protein
MVQSRNFDQTLLRKSFSSNKDREGIPHLISLQKESYEKFLQANVKAEERKKIGIQSVFDSFFPISDSAGKVSVEFISYSLKEPRHEYSECLSAGKTFSSALSAHLRLILWHQEEGSEIKEIRSIKEQEVYLCEIPLMTDSGSFIFNGAERVIVSQMRRAPGVFFDSENVKISGSKSYTAKIIPHIGSWLDFGFSGGANGDNSSYNPHNGISGYNGTTTMRIFSNGVLIGSTGAYPNNITSTSYALDVRGTGYFSSTLTVGGNISGANLSGTNTGDQSIGNGTITIAAGTGIGVGTSNTFTTNQSGATTVTVTNSGVTSNVAGTGISVSGATGAVTITNSGVTSAVAGTGISVSGATGAVTITNSGVTSLAGTTNRITVSAGTGGVTLNLPQDIHTGASPTFAGLSLTSVSTTGATITNLTGAYQNTTVYDSAKTQSATPSRGIRAPASSIQFTDSYAIAPFYTYRSTGDWPVPYGIGWGTGGESSGIFQRYASNGSSFGDMIFYTGNDGYGAFSFRRHTWEGTAHFAAGSGELNTELFRVDWSGNVSMLGTLNGSANSATLYPNNGPYGSWKIGGTRGGWYGIEFESGTILMANSSESGFYRNGVGWQMWWSGGTGYVQKGGSGGGTQATILESSNYTSYTPGLGTNNTLTGINTINNTSNTVINTLSGNLGLTMFQATAGTDAYMTFHIGSDYAAYFGLGGAENDLVYGGWSAGNNRHRILHSGNATYAWNMNQYVRTTDTCSFAGLTVSNTINGSVTGNAGGSSTSCTGNAATATTSTNGFTSKPGWAGNTNLIQTLPNFNNSVPSGFYEYSSATNSPSATWYNLINVRHSNTGNDHGFQLAMSYYDNILWFRSYQGGTGANNGTFQSWAKTLSDQNYNSYSPTLTGTGASGTWAINITGNAATATNGGVTSISAGTGIGTSAGTGAVTITNSSPNATHTGDVTGATALTIANDAVTTVKILNSNVTNAKLANSSLTIGSTAVSLGGTVTTFAGLASVTSTAFVGALTGNASTATALTSMNISQFTNNSGYLTSVTIANGSVTLAKIENITAYTILGNSNASATATPAALSVATVATMLSGQTMNINGSSTSISGFGNPTTAASANTIAYRDGNGDLSTRYFFGSYQNSSDDINTGNISHIMAKFGDNYHRSATAAKVAAFITGQTMNIAGSSTSCTGNSATATNATTAGGLAVQSGTNYDANKIVRTDGNGYILAGWINTISGDNGTTAIDRVYASQDGYIRYYTPANFRTVLDVPTRNGSGVTNFGINTAPSNRLHINGDGTNPAIRVDNGAVVLAASAASNSKTFYGWLPISIAGTTKWIQMYN